MKRSLKLLSASALVIAASSSAHAVEKPAYVASYDGAAQLGALALRSPKVAPASSPSARKQRGQAVSVTARDEARGVPSFAWAAKGQPDLSSASVEDAARAHLGRVADLYHLSPPAIAAAVVTNVHDLGRGGIIVTFGQRVDGAEVLYERMSLILRRDHSLVAVSGHLHPAAAPSSRQKNNAYRVPEERAVAIALDDLYGPSFALPGSLVFAGRSEGGYQRYDFMPPLAAKSAYFHFTRPARVKKVFYPMPQGLVPAYFLELFSGAVASRSSDMYAYVIAAEDGRLLQRKNLTAYETFNYRVWAETTGDKRPLDGPIADFTPNPTGKPDGAYPPFIPPVLVSMDGFNTNPNGTFDPWLATGATETRGNNVDAYTDDDSPDGFSGGSDIRATITGPNTFDRVYDTLAEPTLDDNQRMASLTQIFYVVNWLHDHYYDSGFDEKSGNAQQSNYNRGGLGGDRIHAEGQDGAAQGNLDNANMSTPGDGESPRMQMYLWTGRDLARHLDIAGVGQDLACDSASFGPGDFDLTGEVMLAVDGTAPTGDACEPITNDLTGKIALVDRGSCSFQEKAEAVQAKGAVGMILANHTAGAPPPQMPGDSTLVTIPLLSITFEDGNALKAALQNGPVTAHLNRDMGPKLDGTIDNPTIEHEWGHYLHHRLVDCATNQCGGQSEGWGDFIALSCTIREGDNFHGTYPDGIYANGSFPNAAYFGLRRFPYSTDMTKNPMTFKNISDDEPLPTTAPVADNGIESSEVHNTGEVWSLMLLEAYVKLLDGTVGPNPRYSFEEARRRMADYIVGGMKLAPRDPTFTEQRDAILAAALAADSEDALAIAAGFAKRGAGSCAVAPPRDSNDNTGVVESYDVTGALVITKVTLDDMAKTCDGDGKLDAEETGTLTIDFMNGGIAPIPSATVTLDAEAAGLTINGEKTITVGPVGPLEAIQITFEVVADQKLIDPGLLIAKVTAASDSTCINEVSLNAPFRTNYDNAAAVSTLDDFESDINVWNVGGNPSKGIWSKAVDEAGNHTWHGLDIGDQSDGRLETPPFTISATDPLVISFKHRHSFEASPQEPGGPDVYWDGAVLEISVDGGQFQDITTYVDPGYPGTIGDFGDNPLSGRDGFVSTNPSWPDMDEVKLDLGTALAGKHARIRFRVGSDFFVGDYGWEIDDFQVTGVDDKPFPMVVTDVGSCNAKPIADAGPDQQVPPREVVTLSAKGSSDPEGAELSFAWSQIAGPSVDFTTSAGDTAGFVAPVPDKRTTLTFQVAVSDGQHTSMDTVDVIVDPALRSPLVAGGGCGCRVDASEGSADLGWLSAMGAGLFFAARRRRRG